MLSLQKHQLIIQINSIKSIDKNDHDIVDYTHLGVDFWRVNSTARKGDRQRRGQDEGFPLVSEVMSSFRK